MPSDHDDTADERGGKSGRRKNAAPVPLAAPPAAPPAPFVRRKRVTLADIARRAGVSTAAVSFTLSERLDMPLAASTRARIKQCAKELGYVPNRLSEGFFHGRSKLIGILIVADSFRPLLDCIAGIHEGLASADCFPLLMSPDWIDGYEKNNSAPDRHRAGELLGLRRLLEYQVDGVLHFSTHAEHTAACVRELTDRRIPLVILGGVDPSGSGADTVGGDNEKVGWMAAEHLLSAGCASFAFGMPAPSHPLDAVVRASFVSRLKKAGHGCGDFSIDPENPGDMQQTLSRLVRPPAGVFCARDDVAAVALRAAFALEWSAPRDFALVAMGEAPLSRFNAMPVTTINRNSFAAGEAAAKLLIRRIEGFAGRPKRVLIPPSFEVRASSMSDASWLLRPVPSRPASPPPRSRQPRSRNAP